MSAAACMCQVLQAHLHDVRICLDNVVHLLKNLLPVIHYHSRRKDSAIETSLLDRLLGHAKSFRAMGGRTAYFVWYMEKSGCASCACSSLAEPRARKTSARRMDGSA